jgi:hypothetical protein
MEDSSSASNSVHCYRIYLALAVKNSNSHCPFRVGVQHHTNRNLPIANHVRNPRTRTKMEAPRALMHPHRTKSRRCPKFHARSSSTTLPAYRRYTKRPLHCDDGENHKNCLTFLKSCCAEVSLLFVAARVSSNSGNNSLPLSPGPSTPLRDPTDSSVVSGLWY